MIRRNKIILSVLVAVVLIVVSLIAWAPWITEEYAYAKAMEHLGRPDALFNYLGETMPMRDVQVLQKVPICFFCLFSLGSDVHCNLLWKCDVMRAEKFALSMHTAMPSEATNEL